MTPSHPAVWRSRGIALYSLGIGLAGWALLVHLTDWTALRASLWPLFLFTSLSLIIKRFGVHVARDVTHSLVGIVDLAAVLAFGPVIGAWVGALSGFGYLEMRALRHRLFSWRAVGEQPLFSSGLKVFMAMGCGALYLRLGGAIPPKTMTWGMLLPFLMVLLVWFVLDHLGWALRAGLRGGLPGLLEFFRKILTYSILVELLPLPLAIVIALAYVGMGDPTFLLLALALIASGALLQRFTEIDARLKRRAAELGVLNDLGRALVEAQLDVTQLCELLYEYSSRVVQAPVFGLELVDATRDQVQLALLVDHGQRPLSAETTLPMTGTMQWMANQREPFLSGDVPREGLPFDPHIIGDMPRSLLMVPLLAGPQLIGVLSVQSDEPYAFEQNEMDVLSAMANQVAMAITKARVYEAEQNRSRQLTAIHEVSRRVASILELDRLFSDVVKLVQETFHYDHVGVFTVDAGTGNVAFRASTNPLIQEHGMLINKGEGIVAWVAEHGEPILTNDVSKESRFAYEDILAGTRAELAVPLKVETRIVGVLDVQSNKTDVFGSQDLFVLQTLADQVAIAVEDARLYAERQEEAWSSTALLQVAEAVGSLENLDEILETVVRLTPMLTGVDRCTILLWDDELQEFSSVKSHATSKDSLPLPDQAHIRPGQVPLLDQLRAAKTMLTVEGDDDAGLLPASWRSEWKVGSLLALPLREQAQVQGAMLVDFANPHAQISEHKKTVLAGIADQAAMAVANARLHIAQREEAWVSTALLQVAQGFVSSDDMYDNISRIARLTPLLVGVDRCLVFLWDKSRSEFAVCEAQGLDKELEASCKTWRFKPGDWPLLDAVAQTRNYVAVEDTERNVLVPESLRRTFSIQAALAVPLVSKGELLGVLLVAYTEGPRRFTARRISIIEGIAYQTAIAIDNARLYEASLDQERTAQELRVAREIQISFLPANCPVRRGWEFAADWYAARGVGGDFYDFIPLGRDHLGLVIADVSDKGVPAAMFMSMSRTLVRASALTSRSPARTLERVNELIMTDPRSGMFVTLFYAILNWRTGQLVYCSAGHNPPVLWRHNELVAVPLTTKGIALGVIDDVKLEEQKTLMQPGDVLVLYTDGVTEPINDKEEEFGEERLVQTIAAASGSSCHDIVQRVRTAVCDFVGEPPQFDDYTLVGVKRTA